ncbi:MAG: glycosyl hydrolase [Bryobacteraceae bacterium]
MKTEPSQWLEGRALRPSRRGFVIAAASAGITFLSPVPAGGQPALAQLRSGWQHPPRSCRPHTRWWWPGSAVTREGILWHLDQMKANGIGGVEIIAVWEWYEKGNIPYLSEKWLEMVRFTIDQAEARDMEVAITFGPGWDFGGFWVPPQERSKVLAPCWVDVEGPARFDAELPRYDRSRISKTGLFEYVTEPEGNSPDAHQVLAVVAGRWNGRQMEESTLIDLSERCTGERLQWPVPEGRWRITAFRLEYTGQQNSSQNFRPRNWVVDHFNASAMRRYCEFLTGTFRRAFGDRLGTTVDSFFGDSFEVVPLPDTILWSNELLSGFRKAKGYDLTRYLPALWWDIGELTPRVRYDVNHFLHEVALETVFRTLRETIGAVGVAARIQPHYRFAPEIMQAAGAIHRPETEVTTARFETVADPRKATVAAARFYGRPWVSAEAYTFIHPERYRATLEELKRATDAFLRDGITQFYNHGYVYSPEKEVVPERDVPFAERISHWNPWWPHYRHLADYVARCSFLCRQGNFTGEILIYSPQAQAWTERAVWGIERRVMPYGDLPKTLVANGYDYDPVNDDVLQNRARISRGRLQIGDHSYWILIVQRIRALPVETLRVMERFVASGGVVIALDCLPESSVGMLRRQASDAEVRRLTKSIWGGRYPTAHFLPQYQFVPVPFVSNEQPYTKTPPLRPAQRELLALLGRYIEPDFLLEGERQSDGLTFLHRRAGDVDIYFVTNLQPEAARERVSFAVRGKQAEQWDAASGETKPLVIEERNGRSYAAIDLPPWGSRFFVFAPELPVARPVPKPVRLKVVPVAGHWRLTLSGVRFPKLEKTLPQLGWWTEEEATRYCSGTGVYRTLFDATPDLTQQGLELVLDLGEVAFVAEVYCNGSSAGTCWMQPYRVSLTGLVKPGRNELEVRVTNLLLNHVAALQGPLPVPEELVAHYGARPRYYERSLQATERDRAYRPLPPGGLKGPVVLEVWKPVHQA